MLRFPFKSRQILATSVVSFMPYDISCRIESSPIPAHKPYYRLLLQTYTSIHKLLLLLLLLSQFIFSRRLYYFDTECIRVYFTGHNLKPSNLHIVVSYLLSFRL